MSLELQSIVALYIWFISICSVGRKAINAMASPFLAIYATLSTADLGTAKLEAPKNLTNLLPGLSRFLACLEKASFVNKTHSFIGHSGFCVECRKKKCGSCAAQCPLS